MPLGVRVEIDISGIGIALDELQTRTATYKAAAAGVKLMNRGAKALAPKRTGALRMAQGTKAKKGRKGKTVSFAVQGAKTKYKRMVKGKRIIPAYYDHLVIGGVKPHGIRKRSRLGRWVRGKWRPPRGQGIGKPHPGARANPYRHRAYTGLHGEIEEVMKEALAVEVVKLLAKAHAKMMAKIRSNIVKGIGKIF